MSTTISPEFIHHVRKIYVDSLEGMRSQKSVRFGINVFAIDGLSAYVLAVASVESFINETFFTLIPKFVTSHSPLWNLPKDWIENVELSAKLVLVPQLLFNKSFKRDESPYQDMILLIKIRNDLIHYKMDSKAPKYITPLSDRKIILSALHTNGEADFLWQHKLGCSEGIRWAHNTACHIVKELFGFLPEKFAPLISGLAKNFEPIPETIVTNWMIQNNIDPNSNYPELKSK